MFQNVLRILSKKSRFSMLVRCYHSVYNISYKCPLTVYLLYPQRVKYVRIAEGVQRDNSLPSDDCATTILARLSFLVRSLP